MKSNPFPQVLSLLLFILFSQFLSAQDNCYSKYKSQGDKYKNDRNYDSAIKQYQNAKNCKYLTNSQKIEIDRLIEEVNRMKPAPKKSPTVTRKVSKG